jgi:uncharacterized SAM-binding protein YcdF (DUF218 family)
MNPAMRPRPRVRLMAWAAAAALALAMAAVFVDAPAHWLVVEDPLVHADAALVMTGDVNYERTTAASRLVESGYARLLVLTGGEPWPGDSAASLHAVAIKEGVPPGRIRMEAVSENTRESLLAVGPILRREGVKTLLLVTSPYHQRRAFLAARQAFPDVRIVNRPAPCSYWAPDGWWRKRSERRILFREYLKLGYYVLRGWA